MFKENDKMRPAATPERVLAICRLVGQGSYTTKELTELTELDSDNINEYTRRSISAAEELRLIEKKGDKYQLLIDERSLESAIKFRKKICPIIFSNKKSTFFRLTEWYISNYELVKGINKFDEFAATAAKNGVESVDENDVLGWRFWMRFLGHAYQFNRTLIPNMFIRIGDALENVDVESSMNSGRFLMWLKENVPEAAASCTNEGLPIAVSNGLRSLQEAGKIELISTMDAAKISLYPMDGDVINDFSEIKIRR